MKNQTLAFRLLFFSAVTLLCFASISWKPDRGDALGTFLKTFDYALPANMSLDQKSNFKKLLAARFFKMPMKKKIGTPTVYWSVWQESSPYRDANLYLEIDNVAIFHEFWTNSGEVGTSIYEGCGTLKLDSNVYEQWVGYGTLNIFVDRFDGSYWTNLDEQHISFGPGNTPEYGSGSYHQTFDLCYGYDYYVSVSATP